MSSAPSLVVLVEPEAVISDTLESSLRHAGFQVLTTPDGEDALRIVEGDTLHVDAVLIDVALTGVGGDEIATVLAEYRPDVPVVLMTARPLPRSSRIGRDGHTLEPPLDAHNITELVGRLRATIDRVAHTQQQFEAARDATGSLLAKNRRLRTERESLISAARALVARRSPPPCPQCTSSRIAAILYGSERLNRRDELASGTVVLGGAHHTDGPTWYCRDCDHRW
jgi:DNA-binding response OmpR family regulator